MSSVGYFVFFNADWVPQADLPRDGQGAHRPRGGDCLPGGLPPPAEHRVVLRQPQHDRLPAALHAGGPGVRLPRQAGLVNQQSHLHHHHPPPPPSSGEVAKPSSASSQ